jgi:uncharacterized membrane protein
MRVAPTFESSTMQSPLSANAVEFSRVARRNRSISQRGLLMSFGSLMLIVLAIAIVFAVLGAWLVLPFAGIEIAVLAAALTWVARHALDYERICFNAGMLEIEIADGGKLTLRQFNPAWASLVVEHRGPATRIALRSHGSELEIGRHLNAGGKRGLARELGALGLRAVGR